ncbi:restriction endonuclease subunit S [Glycomyces sp. NPDC048151]|uniref:restriction endonuclease subunit S n=1 Tax=Glycomyces sp. NPDC048151 TaxID=3364002 RepID=UPI003716B4DF
MNRWKSQKLADLAVFYPGTAFPIKYQGRSKGAIPFAKVGDISKAARSRKRYLTSTDHYIDQTDLAELRARLIPPGTVVFAKIGEAIRHNYRVVTSNSCLIDNNAMGVKPNNEALDSGYFYHFTRTLDFYQLAASTTVPSVRKSDLAEIEVPLPSLDEQQRIAAVLDKVDVLREQRRRAIALLDELTQSIFIEMFGNPPDRWAATTVENVAKDQKGSIRTGPFGSQLLHEEFVEEGVAVLGIDNAVSNEFRWSGRRFITLEKYRKLSRYKVHPGDVLITIMGTCGRSAVVPVDIPEAINTKHLCCITLDQDQCLPDFLHDYFLMHPIAKSYLAKTTKGAIMSGLNMGIIKMLPLKLPPLDLQLDYVSKIAAIRTQKQAAQAHLAELDALFASVQWRAFRGELWETSSD